MQGQNWKEIAEQVYQAIFDDVDIIVQQVGPNSPFYDVMTPSGAVSDHLDDNQVTHILNEFGARSVRPGGENE